MKLKRCLNRISGVIKMYLSIGQAAEVIGVSISTLRRWEQEGSFMPCYRTKGNHRRYSFERIERDILKKTSQF